MTCFLSAQLPPIDGRLLWLSPHMLTTFDCFTLKHLVRAADDTDLQEVIRITRLPWMDRVLAIPAFMEIFRRRCTKNFRANWSQISDNIVRVVSFTS